MTLSERLAEYVRAAFSGLWVRSHESVDALAELALCRAEGWALATWDVDRGLETAGPPTRPPSRAPPTRWPPSAPWPPSPRPTGRLCSYSETFTGS